MIHELKEIRKGLVAALGRHEFLKEVVKLDTFINKLSTDKALIIEQLVKDEYGFTFEDISIKSHAAKFAKPRQVAMYLLMKYSTLKDVDIAKKFNRSKDVVRYSVGEVRSGIETDKIYREMIKSMEEKINEKSY